MDKAFIGTIPDGRRFFAVEREGRHTPLLNGKGEVEFWTKEEAYRSMYSGPGDFARVLQAMDHPEKLKVVNGS